MTTATDLNALTVNMAEALLGPALSRGQHNDLAVICRDEQISYGELDKRANRAGNAFKRLDVNIGDRVLMMVRDTPDFFYIYLGLLKIGAVPVGLSTRLAAQDLAYIIEDSESVLFILDHCFSELYADGLALVINAPTTIFTDMKIDGTLYFQTLVLEAMEELQAVQLQWDSPAIWMYSSGTTGKPKGVVHLQRTVLASTRLMGEVLGVGPGDRIYSTSKLFFAFSLAHCFFASLQLGATTILDPDWPDPNIVNLNVQRFKPTVMLSVPTFYRQLLRDNLATKPAFKKVRHYLTAGEKMPASLFHDWIEATGRAALEGIGATETCFLFLVNRPENLKPGTCGLPTPGTEVKLIDQDGEIIVDAGRPGVLWVRMLSLACGYWKLEEKTEDVFQEGWYCTNDMFTVDKDGMYEHQGRADDMLKISGQWVSPSEIEEQVQQHPKVSDAAVVGVPNEDGLVRLALFIITPEAGTNRKKLETEIRELIVKNLSIYKCPRNIYYVDNMPVTATGKLKRFALRALVVGGETGV